MSSFLRFSQKFEPIRQLRQRIRNSLDQFSKKNIIIPLIKLCIPSQTIAQYTCKFQHVTLLQKIIKRIVTTVLYSRKTSLKSKVHLFEEANHKREFISDYLNNRHPAKITKVKVEVYKNILYCHKLYASSIK